jgi:hypothetical protein
MADTKRIVESYKLSHLKNPSFKAKWKMNMLWGNSISFFHPMRKASTTQALISVPTAQKMKKNTSSVSAIVNLFQSLAPAADADAAVAAAADADAAVAAAVNTVLFMLLLMCSLQREGKREGKKSIRMLIWVVGSEIDSNWAAKRAHS